VRLGSLAWISLAACGRLGFDAAGTPDAVPDAAPVDCSVLADDTPCDDRDICTDASSCQAGACVSASQVTSCTVASSALEFEPTQGSNGWFYGFWDPVLATPYDPDTDFVLGVYDDATSIYTPMVPDGEFIYLAVWGGHPKNNPAITVPVRRWVSDVSGPAFATYGVRKADISCGDGVEARLVVDGTVKSTQTVAFDDNTGATISVSVELSIGTRVELLLAPNLGEECDTTETELTIASPTE
jgi:hypothetical protein